MKPFDLQEALNGAPVRLRNGCKAFIFKNIQNTHYLSSRSGIYARQKSVLFSRNDWVVVITTADTTCFNSDFPII